MYGGKASGARNINIQSRVPQGTEVAIGNMHFAYDFTPVYVSVSVTVTATPALIFAWDGAITIAGNTVELDNGAAADWAATHTVHILVTD